MPLEEGVLKKLLTMDKQNKPAGAPQQGWLNPLNRIIWHKAFVNRDTRVTLRDGRKFIIDYDVPDFVIKTLGENIKAVHVRMAPLRDQPSWVETSFVPFGFFDLRDVTNPEWIKTGGDKTVPVR